MLLLLWLMGRRSRGTAAGAASATASPWCGGSRGRAAQGSAVAGGESATARRAALEDALTRGDAGAVARACVAAGGLSARALGRGAAALRARAWLMLLEGEPELRTVKPEAQGLAPRRAREVIAREVAMDVARSLHHLDCCRALARRERERLRAELSDTVVDVLASAPHLHYYQGFHDVCTVVLHVFGRSAPAPGAALCPASQAALWLAQRLFADHHQRDFNTTMQVMALLPEILSRFDPELARVMASADCGPMFALSWVITGFAHSVEDAEVVERIYDALVASHPALPVYLAAALVTRPTTRRHALRVAAKYPGDMAVLHHALQNAAPPVLADQRSLRRRAKVLRAWSKKRKSGQAAQQELPQQESDEAKAPQRSSEEEESDAEQDPSQRQRQRPMSRREAAENDVDLLVDRALEMMVQLPPDAAIRMLSARTGQPGVNPSSVVHWGDLRVAGAGPAGGAGPSAAWAAIVAATAERTGALAVSAWRPRRLPGLRAPVYLVLATAVGISAYLSWTGRPVLW